QLTNLGPDPTGTNITLTDPLPPGVTFVSQPSPLGWTVTDPDAANGNTVTFTSTNINLRSGDFADLYLAVHLNTLLSTPLSDTTTIGTSLSEINPANNSVTLTVFNGGHPFTDAVLYHFPAPSPGVTGSEVVGTVNWGDNSPSNSSDDGTGTVAVVANPNGGFDVLGSHTYTFAGTYLVGLTLSSTLPGLPSLVPD